MIPYSRPKLSDFFTPSQSVEILKTIPFLVTHTYLVYMWQFNPSFLLYNLKVFVPCLNVATLK